MQLEYLDGVFEEIDSEESREISGGEEVGIGIIGVAVVGVSIVCIGKGLENMANNAYKEQTKGGTLVDQNQHGGGSSRRY